MASPSPVEIIDTALFCTTIFAPSYTDPDQKWLIRDHLLSLHQEFHSLYPTMATYLHNDGTMVNLLKAEGDLHVSRSLPPVPITIWIHENYPHMAPIVQVTSSPVRPRRLNHPFVDSSGMMTSSYLHTWEPQGYSLLGLAYNLVKLFSLDHPFCYVNTPNNLSHPSYVSRMEGMDRLWCMIHYDMIALKENTKDEIENLAALQAEMRTRADMATNMISELDNERMKLKRSVRELTEEADVVMNWLRANDARNSSVTMIEDVFECVGEDSRWVLELVAENKGLEDLMYELEKAVEAGVVSFQVYIKQVRSLARDQFFTRAKLEKLKGPQILQWLD